MDTPTATPTDVATTIVDEHEEQLKILDHFLQNITIGGQTMKAGDFVDMDNDTPVFNEWFDNCENILACDINEQDDEDDDDSNSISTDTPPKITEAIEMTHKLRLLATTQQSQLHKLINELESKLIDVYIESKNRRQTTVDDFFN